MTELQKGVYQLVKISGLIGLVSLVLSIIEGFVYRYTLKKDYDFLSALNSYLLRFVRIAMGYVPLVVTFPLGYWMAEHALFDATTLGIWSYVILFVGFEFSYYWRHRLAHQMRWFWLGHFVHHSPNHLNLSVAFRVEWTSILMGAYLFHVLPLSLLGFEPLTIIGSMAFIGALGLWNHAEWIPKLGPLEGIINTPSAHRVHHARNPEYLGSHCGANFGGFTVIFDRIFGTYIPERDDVKCDYGLVKRFHSNNPFKITFYPFYIAYQDMKKLKSIRLALKYLFVPQRYTPRTTPMSDVSEINQKPTAEVSVETSK